MNCFVSYKFGFRVARSRRPEKEEPGGEAEGGVEDGREGNKDEPAGGTERRKVNQGSRGAAGLRAILKEEGGKGGGQDGKGLKVGRGRSSKLGRRGWSEDGKTNRPGSEIRQRSKEKKSRGGGGSSRGEKEDDGQRGVKGVGVSCSQSLSGLHPSLGRVGENCLMPGEDLLMVRRYRTRGRSLGPGPGSRVNKNIISI